MLVAVLQALPLIQLPQAVSTSSHLLQDPPAEQLPTRLFSDQAFLILESEVKNAYNHSSHDK